LLSIVDIKIFDKLIVFTYGNFLF